MKADEETRAAIQLLVERTYQALSVPGHDLASIFGHEDLSVAGSGQGELMNGPSEVVPVAASIAAQRMSWVPEHIQVWRRGDVAWAQILGYVDRAADAGRDERVPYWTTGVFGHDANGWQWLYWGGSEPQAAPKV
jgi:hypothetical protein